jgi:hypothetical protein
MEQMQYAKPEEREKFLSDLYAPPEGADPDRVTQDVVEEEMSMFRSLARQTGPGGEA